MTTQRHANDTPQEAEGQLIFWSEYIKVMTRSRMEQSTTYKRQSDVYITTWAGPATLQSPTNSTTSAFYFVPISITDTQ